MFILSSTMMMILECMMMYYAQSISLYTVNWPAIKIYYNWMSIALQIIDTQCLFYFYSWIENCVNIQTIFLFICSFAIQFEFDIMQLQAWMQPIFHTWRCPIFSIVIASSRYQWDVGSIIWFKRDYVLRTQWFWWAIRSNILVITLCELFFRIFVYLNISSTYKYLFLFIDSFENK